MTRSSAEIVTRDSCVQVPIALACDTSSPSSLIHLYCLLACNPTATVAELAARLDCTARNVQHLRKRLVDGEFVTVQPGGGRGNPNVYTVRERVQPQREKGATGLREKGATSRERDSIPSTSDEVLRVISSPPGSNVRDAENPAALFEAPAVEPTPTKRRCRVPDDFAVSERMLAWARDRCPAVTPERETEKFMNFHQAKGSTMLDWAAAWRTWMGNAQGYAERDRGRGFSPGRPRTTTEAGMALLRERGALR